MGKKIYLLEDNEDIKEMLGYLLSHQGYVVFGFTTIDDFYTQLNKVLPDLFILDIMLPGGNGADICSEIKSHATMQHIPVMLMTANLKFRPEDSTADDFIRKPFDIDEFKVKIKNLLPEN